MADISADNYFRNVPKVCTKMLSKIGPKLLATIWNSYFRQFYTNLIENLIVIMSFDMKFLKNCIKVGVFEQKMVSI